MYQGLHVADTPIHVASYVKQIQKSASVSPISRDRASLTFDSDNGGDSDLELPKQRLRGGSTGRGARAGGGDYGDDEVRRVVSRLANGARIFRLAKITLRKNSDWPKDLGCRWTNSTVFSRLFLTSTAQPLAMVASSDASNAASG